MKDQFKVKPIFRASLPFVSKMSLKRFIQIQIRIEQRYLRRATKIKTNKMMKKMLMASQSSTKISSAAFEAVFLEHKQKKKWIDEKTGYVCYTIFARALYITWGGEGNYWDWNCFKEMGDDGTEVAKLRSVCWVDVRGKFKISLLSPGVEYEIFYVVKVKRGGSGWELPVTLALSIPKKMDQARKVSLLDQPHGEWIELSVGRFTADANETEEINYDLYEHGGHWKDGLVVHSAIIRPSVH